MPQGAALLEPPPRDERRIIRDAQRSGLFPGAAPSRRAATMRELEVAKANAELRMVQDRRRANQNAQRVQMDYERILGDQAASTIPPLRTFRHQMNDRRRISEQILAE